MSDKIYRDTILVDVIEKDETKKELVIVASTDEVNRKGNKVDIKSMRLDNFRKNPVLGYFHRYDEPAVGKVLWIKKTSDGKLKAKIQFADTERGRELSYLYSNGYMNAFSIGYIVNKIEKVTEKNQEIYVLKDAELLEISVVLVPANANALVAALRDGMINDDMEILKDDDFKAHIKDTVIKYKKTPLAPEDTKWNGPAEVRAATVDDLKNMCAWYDAEKPEVKASYKLPHHLHEKPYKCVWNGVRAAMAALLGARGGVKIPDSDRKGVYNHLAKHYADFGKEPPEFRDNYTEEELKDLFPEVYELPDYEWNFFIGEINYIEYLRLKQTNAYERIGDIFNEMKDLITALQDDIKELREKISKMIIDKDRSGDIRSDNSSGDVRSEDDEDKIDFDIATPEEIIEILKKKFNL